MRTLCRPSQPIVIIGAPRSGTNMLRNALAQLPGTVTWPCDEINYIWRHFNTAYPTDELPPRLATPRAERFIHRAFDQVARRTGARIVVEKTCANSLRVPFVRKILPNAKFVFLIRDGLDVVASARQRWTAGLDLPYLVRKARFVPPGDFAHYAVRYAKVRVYRMFSGEGQVSTWGPRFEGMQQQLKQRSIAEMCALQWKHCVEKAHRSLRDVEQHDILPIRYEDFVHQPVEHMRRIAQRFEVDVDQRLLSSICSGISPSSIGKWNMSLDAESLRRIEPILRDTQALIDSYYPSAEKFIPPCLPAVDSGRRTALQQIPTGAIH